MQLVIYMDTISYLKNFIQGIRVFDAFVQAETNTACAQTSLNGDFRKLLPPPPPPPLA